MKDEELVNDDADNIEEVDNDDWNVEVASACVQVKKIKLVSKKMRKEKMTH